MTLEREDSMNNKTYWIRLLLLILFFALLYLVGRIL